MPQLTITKNYDDGTALTETQLDAIKSSIETFVNTTKLDGDNIATGGVTATQLASSAVTTAKIDTGAVTTAKLADSAVTQVKRAALGHQLSSTCGGAYTNATTSYTDATNLTVTITTTGRPVWIGLIHDGNTTGTDHGTITCLASGSTTTISGYIKITRDVTLISEQFFQKTEVSAATGQYFYFPSSSICHVDPITAGTYTYKISMKAGTNTTVGVRYSKLIAYEL